MSKGRGNIYADLRLCHVGDVSDIRQVVLNGIDSLSSVASIETHVSRGGVTHTLTTIVSDPINNVVDIDLGTDPTDWLPSEPDTGEWLGQIEVVFNGGAILTWPAVGSYQGFFAINVVRELG